MELLFVGTGAADYTTPHTCDCRTCTGIRQRGGRNIRHYASLLLDGRILLDCGPTVPWRLAELDVPPAQIEALVFTHSHEDHVDAGAVADLLRARGDEQGRLRVYGNSESLAVLADLADRLELTAVAPGDEVSVLGRRFRAVRANHVVTPEELTLNWLIEHGDGWLLYATDTGWPLPETWAALAAEGLAAAVVEATFGTHGEADLPPGYLSGHMNWPTFLRLREEFLARGILAAEAPYLSTHMSQHFAVLHEELEREAEAPVVLAFDGLRVRV
jgi:Cft2 family RNA processing exonuclease